MEGMVILPAKKGIEAVLMEKQRYTKMRDMMVAIMTYKELQVLQHMRLRLKGFKWGLKRYMTHFYGAKICHIMCHKNVSYLI